MYLLVFITLVIALTGIYAEVLTVQTARLYSKQTTLADAMVEWHATAITQARYAMTTTTTVTYPDAAGCSFTSTPPVGVPICASASGNITVDGNPPNLMLQCGVGGSTNCYTVLPTGYKKAFYTFYSIYYQPTADALYIVTYVPPPAVSATNPAPGYIILPDGTNGTQVGGSMDDLTRQIRNKGLSPLTYGFANAANQLVTPNISNGTSLTTFTYPLPAAIPANSIVLISQR